MSDTCPTCGRKLNRSHPQRAATPLHRARLERGLTLRQMVAQMGEPKMSISYISAMERNDLHNPTIATARRLAEFFETDIDSLFPNAQN